MLTLMVQCDITPVILGLRGDAGVDDVPVRLWEGYFELVININVHYYYTMYLFFPQVWQYQGAAPIAGYRPVLTTACSTLKCSGTLLCIRGQAWHQRRV